MRAPTFAIALLLPAGLAFAALAQSTQSPALQAPVSHLIPGATPLGPTMQNPLASDPQAATRGMRDFLNFNCVGCHAPNAGGGMGPSLSERQRVYGDKPAELFLSIYQGRPNGMPAWGEALPENVIWELVAYIQGITEPPGKTFGATISRTPQEPEKQQVPAEFLQTIDPWSSTEAFSNGQKPSGE
jgi:cytochrome c oxidase cbb3-type subunit 3